MTTQDQLNADRLNAEIDRILHGTAPSDRPERDDDVATAELLAEGLGRLRAPRQAFRDQLEARLLAALPEATRSDDDRRVTSRPWWRAFTSTARRDGRVTSLPRRRLLVGLAAGAAGLLAFASISLPVGRTPEASAAEILEKARTIAENPFASSLKSFHLTAEVSGRRPGGRGDGKSTTEQWFVAPDKMRMESRVRGADGKTVVSGMVHVGSNLTQYATPGAEELDVIGVLAIPAVMPADGPSSKDDKVHVAIRRRIEDGEAPKDGEKVAVYIRRDPSQPGDKELVEEERVIRQVGPGGELPEGGPEVIVLENCPPPQRKGEGTVAGRKVNVVEIDHSACLPKDAPAEMRGKVVTWADQQTFLPLKIEHYDPDGKLVHSYVVTKVEYDVAIPDSVFNDIPPKGTEVRRKETLPGFPGVPVEPPTAAPTR